MNGLQAGQIGVLAALLAGGVGRCLAAETGAASAIRWHVAGQRLDAEFTNSPLEETLAQLAAATHWRILYEPGVEHRTYAAFRDAKVGEGLRRLLGPLNFAYVPGSSGPAQLLIFNSSAKEATELVSIASDAAAGGPHKLDDELIVRVSGGAVDIDALAAELGAEVIGRLDELGAYRLKFKDAAAANDARRRLTERGASGMQDNYAIDHPGAGGSLSQAGLSTLNLRPGNAQGDSQVIVAVIDTPVQGEGTAIQDFLLPAINVTGSTVAASDSLSHGTSMATTILNSLAGTGVSGDTPVRILPVDVYGANPSTSSFDVARGIQSAINAGADIINLSLGGDGSNPLVHEVIAAGRAAGVVFLGAAGNEPLTTPTYPAAYQEVVAVTALDRNGQVAAYANHGDFVDVGAPGLSIVPFEGRPYYVVGTSAATAYVSGQAAALAAFNGLQGAQLEAAVRHGTTPIPPATAP